MRYVYSSSPLFAALVVASIGAFASLALAQEKPAPVTVAAIDQTALAGRIDALLDKHYPAGEPGAAVVVSVRGQTVYRAARGMANLEKGIALKSDDVFRLGSITKQFTAVAILKLVDEGRLKLDDEIGRHIPGYPDTGKGVTIEQLLAHTAGVPSYTDSPEYAASMEKPVTHADMLARFAGKPLEFKPGTQWKYSNSGYYLLGMVIENVSGRSYADYVARNLFIPLGMQHSAYEGHERSGKRRVEGYARADGKFAPDSPVHMSQPYAAGSLLSTVNDLAIWNRAISEGKILRKETWAKAFTPATLAEGSKTRYGHGFMFDPFNGTQSIHHGGGINGFLTHAVRLPQEDIYVAILTNTRARGGLHVTLSQRIAALAMGKPFPDQPAITLDDAALDRHIGIYKIDEKTSRNVFRDGNQLFSQRTGGQRVALAPASATDFFNPESLVSVRFESDTGGETMRAVFRQATGEDTSPRVSKVTPLLTRRLLHF